MIASIDILALMSKSRTSDNYDVVAFALRNRDYSPTRGQETSRAKAVDRGIVSYSGMDDHSLSETVWLESHCTCTSPATRLRISSKWHRG